MPEKSWSVEFSKASLKSLEKLEKNISLKILDRIEELADTKNPLLYKDVRPLAGKLKGFFRLRVGEFRAIFELDSRNKRIGILAVVPRKKAY